MDDMINRIIQPPRLELKPLFDDKPAHRTEPEKPRRASDQFRFTTESSMEGFYKNPKYNTPKNDKVEEAELKTENWFG